MRRTRVRLIEQSLCASKLAISQVRVGQRREHLNFEHFDCVSVLLRDEVLDALFSYENLRSEPWRPGSGVSGGSDCRTNNIRAKSRVMC